MADQRKIDNLFFTLAILGVIRNGWLVGYAFYVCVLSPPLEERDRERRLLFPDFPIFNHTLLSFKQRIETSLTKMMIACHRVLDA